MYALPAAGLLVAESAQGLIILVPTGAGMLVRPEPEPTKLAAVMVLVAVTLCRLVIDLPPALRSARIIPCGKRSLIGVAAISPVTHAISSATFSHPEKSSLVFISL